jgi:hypothetical protein
MRERKRVRESEKGKAYSGVILAFKSAVTVHSVSERDYRMKDRVWAIVPFLDYYYR